MAFIVVLKELLELNRNKSVYGNVMEELVEYYNNRMTFASVLKEYNNLC
jgi:hypothetical protein